ncbi:hypothetical protein HXK64_00035 [Candidatus Gracilibacteria bacterium]|nr:hypothetical protein [Candidatus Gracilibacteria bacterium]
MIEFVDAYKDFLRELGYGEGYKYLFTHTYVFFEGSYFRLILFLEHFGIFFIFGSHFWGLVWEFIIPTFLKGVFYDVILISFGVLVGYIKPFRNLIYDNNKLFLIYFRFIPFLGNFGAFFGGILSSKIEFKDFKYIIYGNALAILVGGIFWDIFVHIYGEKIDPIRWF